MCIRTNLFLYIRLGNGRIVEKILKTDGRDGFTEAVVDEAVENVPELKALLGKAA